jgi:hypothetical protein
MQADYRESHATDMQVADWNQGLGLGSSLGVRKFAGLEEVIGGADGEIIE